MQLTKAEKQLLRIERASGDLRRGMAVLIEAGSKKIMAISPDNIAYINALSTNHKAKNKKLIISKARAEYLFPDSKIIAPVAIDISTLSANKISAICSSSPLKIKLKAKDFTKAIKLEISALQLTKIAELIPAVIIFEPTGKVPDEVLSINASDIDTYQENINYSLIEATRTSLNLTHAADTEIIAYRPSIGAPEHYAIIIGKPSKEPLVRIHSSCYTGDLLASLDCDCRDQLQSAIELMGNPPSQNSSGAASPPHKPGVASGGIILYLMQEGRGIGLVNKLRAYDLKHKGMDTVEANRALGFDDDERLFLPAAEILKKLKIKKVQLLTNNPRKAKGLEECGIKVTKCIPHIMASNQHNDAYLKTKAGKMGHKLK